MLKIRRRIEPFAWNLASAARRLVGLSRRRLGRVQRAISAAALLLLAGTGAVAAEDPYLWLEEIDSPRALEWVEARNAATASRLTARPEYRALYRDALAVLNSASRIPEVSAHGGYLYNLWQDEQHPRGVFRRTTLAELRRDEPRWETVLDVDALAKAEGRPWAMGEVYWRRPDEKRCLIQLAPAGGDAAEVREFDLETLRFVDGGFVVPTAKSRVAWAGDDALYVATDFGPGTLTASGYPRILKRWQRGTPLSAAETLHEAPVESVWVLARRFGSGADAVHVIIEAQTFWRATFFLVDGAGAETRLVPLRIPPTSNVVDALHGRLVIWLKEDWEAPDSRRYGAGSVVIADPAALHGGAGKIEVLFGGPGARVQGGRNVSIEVSLSDRGVAPPAAVDGGRSHADSGVADAGRTRAEERVEGNALHLRSGTREAVTIVEAVHVGADEVFVTFLENVQGRLARYTTREGGWAREVIPFPDQGAVNVVSVDATGGEAWVEFESFTTPPTLYHLAARAARPEQIKAQAPTFDGARFQVQQLWCTSADGTQVPYFVVAPRDVRLDGSNPVWMFSYGGFENSLTPSYSGSYEDLKGAYGKLWLERGGVFVLANIRGGGEFGPEWHTSVLKENHYKCFEDFEAVARDLVARKLTSPAKLGIEGRSNGGLLVAATMLRHPELYGAVVCGNPLLDMRRYHQLLAGASWMAEYGNPDLPEEWAYLREYSPYQNVRAGMELPPIFFYTTTRDDRVHPGHARKMAARMHALGYAIDYYENTEGGHHGSVTSEQLATRVARTFAFLWEKLGDR